MTTKKFDYVKYQSDYRKANYKSVIVYIPLNDSEVLDKLNSVKSKSNYIYQLIKDDIKDKKIIENLKDI